jgi:hypothetical protein
MATAFASQMAPAAPGAEAIIADPRRIDLVRTPHTQADYHRSCARRTSPDQLAAHVV